MKDLLLLLAGLLSGVLLGGAAHFLTNREEADRPLSPQEVRVHHRETLTTHQAPTDPRPTFDEVCKADGPEMVRLLSRYLVDASAEEVIELLEMGENGGSISLRKYAWMIHIRGIEVDPHALLAWTKALEHPSSLLDSLYTRWTVIDPHAALKTSLLEGASSRRVQKVAMDLMQADPDRAHAAMKELLPDHPLLAVLERRKWEPLARENRKVALDDAMRIIDQEERQRAVEAVVMTWADKDPALALRWLDDQNVLSDTKGLERSLITKLSRTNPYEAYQELERIPPSRSRVVLEKEIAKEMAAQDPDRALQWLKSLPDSPPKDHLLVSMIDELDLEPHRLIELVRELNVNAMWSDQSYQISSHLGDRKFENAGESSRDMSQAIQQAIREIAEDSPKQAIEALYSLNDYQQTDVREIAEIWVARDTSAAAEWAATLPRGLTSDGIKDAIFAEWAEKSPVEVAAFLSERSILPSQQVTETVAHTWAQEDLDSAIEWIATVKDSFTEEVMASVIEQAAYTDPIQALQYVERIENPELYKNALTHVANNWRTQDPEGAMTWLATLPPEGGMGEVVSNVSRAWVLERPEAASEWIGGMENGLIRDHAVAGMIDAVTATENPTKDFTAAESWLHTLADRQLQEQWAHELATRRQ